MSSNFGSFTPFMIFSWRELGIVPKKIGIVFLIEMIVSDGNYLVIAILNLTVILPWQPYP